MNAAYFDDTEVAAVCGVTAESASSEICPSKHIDVAEFRRLAVSHRHMVRLDKPDAGLKGLRDLDTGETFFTDALRLAAK